MNPIRNLVHSITRSDTRDERFPLAIGSFVCLVLLINTWLSWVSPLSIIVHVEYACYTMLLMAVPFAPNVASVLIILLSIFGLFVPAGPEGAGMGWLNMDGTLFAFGILGMRFGRLGISIPLVIVVSSAAISFRIYPAIPMQIATWGYILMPYSLAWMVGSTIRYLNEREASKRIKLHEAAEQRERLRLIHVMHDSIANSLVYAIRRCRSASDGMGSSQQVLNELPSLLEQVLQELRTEVMAPVMRTVDQYDDDSEKADGNPDQFQQHGPENDERIRRFVLDQTVRLNVLGFIGTPIFLGVFSGLDDEHIAVLQDTVVQICGNMMNHGIPGCYSLVVRSSGNNDFAVISSNQSAERQERASTGFGLAHVSDRVGRLGGSVRVDDEDGWLIVVSVPANTATTANTEHFTDLEKDNG